jgi:hypothetical protein
MANVPATKAAAQKAIDYCVFLHQSGVGQDKGGWGFEPKSEPNLAATAWFIVALKSAKVAGLHVPPAAFDGAIKFLDSIESKDANGISLYRFSMKEARAEQSAKWTAMGTLARQFLGWKREDLQPAVEGFIAKGGLPAWSEKADLSFWYFGTLGAFQQGGEVWVNWNEAIKKALTENQSKSGGDAGSWQTAGSGREQLGRAGQTALACLCLETYYRYLQLTPVSSSSVPAAVRAPSAESGKDAVDYSEYIRALQEGKAP